MKHDYDLSEVEQISFRGLKYSIMPRYKYHYQNQNYEKFSLDLLQLLIEEGSTVIDIGAHYGIYSLIAAKKAKKVYAFEPVPENFKILNKNIADNSITNLDPINKAVSDRVEEVTFNVPWASDSAGFYEHPNAETIKKIKVQTTTIDTEVAEHNISLIKIDTEGHEIHVLNGLKNTLKNNKKAKMLIEYNPSCLARADCKGRDLLITIERLGYDMFAVHEDERDLVKLAPDMPTEQILRGKGYLNILCLPKGQWTGVLFLSHSASIGGAELNLLEIMEHIPEHRDKLVLPYVVLPGEGSLTERLRNLPAAVHVVGFQTWVEHKHLGPTESQSLNALNMNAIIRMTRIVEDFKPDVVFTNTLVIPWGGIIAKAWGVPHILSINEYGDLDHGFTFDYGYTDSLKILNDLTDKFLVNSKAVQAHVTKVIPARKTEQLYYNVIDSKQQITGRTEEIRFKNKNALKLIISGRVMPTKGQFDAVKALNILRQAGNEVELIILGPVGSETYSEEIKAHIKKHKLENYVHMLGHRDNPHDYVALADIFLMCSRNEAFGRVTVEAMYLSKPIVGTKSGGTQEIITDGVSGYLYEPGNVEELVQKIIKLAKAPATIKKMGAAARKEALSKFQNDYYEQLYKNLETAKHNDKNQLYERILKDLLKGSVVLSERANNQISELSEKYNQDIAHYSQKYNELYKAYNEAGAQLEELKSKNIYKISNKLKRGHKPKNNS